MTLKKKILVITSARPEGWLDEGVGSTAYDMHAFNRGIEKLGDFECWVTSVNKLSFTVRKDAVSITDTYNNNDLSFYDIVHFRNVNSYWDFARAITTYMHFHGKQVFEMIDGTIPDFDKLSQMVLFALNGLQVPETFVCWNPTDLHDELQKNGIHYPWILKSNSGIMGRDNFLVRSEKESREVVENNPTLRLLGQSFIPNEGDYRVLFFGENISPLIFKKVAGEGTHLNNTSRGGASFIVEVDEFDPEALRLATEATRLTKRTLAGVDIMQDKETGEWYILEVNANPALASGALIDKKIEKYSKMLKEIL